MARNIRIFVSSESNGLTPTVPDFDVAISAEWTDPDGTPQSDNLDTTFVTGLAWLRNNHPVKAKILMHKIAVAIALVQRGVREDVDL